MNSNLKWILPALLGANLAHATPTLYPTDMNLLSRLVNPTTSGLVADDNDVRKVYVLPPNEAVAEVRGLHTLSANVGFCGEVSDLQQYSRSVLAQIKELNDRRDDYKIEVDKAFEKLKTARIEAEKIIADKRLQPLVDLDNQIKDMQDRLTELYASSQTCKVNCGSVENEIRGTQDALRNAQKDRRTLAQQNAQDVRAYDKKKAEATAFEQNYRDIAQRFNQAKQDLMSIRSEFQGMYSAFAKMEGGRAALVYNSNWDQNLETLRVNNPDFQFEKISTEKATLFASLTSVKDIPADLTVLAYELPGVHKDNYMDLQSAFPSSISSNLVLSLIGVCPMLHPESFDVSPGYGADKMAYGLTITYEFPATMKVQATAKYNMYKMYQKIVSSGSSGGFFSSRSWTKVEEHNFFKDSFRIEWETQDPKNEVSEEQRLTIESEMRARIMERIANLALPSAPNRDQIIAASAPPPHGAVVVANSLMTACPGNIYCVAGSLILQGLDSIFGSSQSTASYLQTQDFEATETWSSSKVVMKPWVTTFVPKR